MMANMARPVSWLMPAMTVANMTNPVMIPIAMNISCASERVTVLVLVVAVEVVVVVGVAVAAGLAATAFSPFPYDDGSNMSDHRLELRFPEFEDRQNHQDDPQEED